ncbi:hypothetical protein GCM10027589_59680 [Actinocorallia lasiicapitis]
MAVDETVNDTAELAVQWRRLVAGWAGEGRAVPDGDGLSVEFDLPDGRVMTVRFMRTARLLVAFMTDGTPLRRDQLAQAAAAANAWNTEQLVPMLSVWDVHGPHPVLAGVSSLPAELRLDQREFSAVAADWAERGAAMFVRCRQVFDL